MKSARFILVSGLFLFGLPFGTAYTQGSTPVAGKTELGVSAAEMDKVIDGWSVKKNILDKDVYNAENQKIGKIEDIIISPDDAVSYAIIGVGGFLGIDRHDVVVPVDQFDLNEKKLTLSGATKGALKSLPKFEYAPKK